jgi:hypothetical protein
VSETSKRGLTLTKNKKIKIEIKIHLLSSLFTFALCFHCFSYAIAVVFRTAGQSNSLRSSLTVIHALLLHCTYVLSFAYVYNFAPSTMAFASAIACYSVLDNYTRVGVPHPQRPQGGRGGQLVVSLPNKPMAKKRYIGRSRLVSKSSRARVPRII